MEDNGTSGGEEDNGKRELSLVPSEEEDSVYKPASVEEGEEDSSQLQPHPTHREETLTQEEPKGGWEVDVSTTHQAPLPETPTTTAWDSEAPAAEEERGRTDERRRSSSLPPKRHYKTHLYIGNLPKDVTAKELGEAFQE